MKLETVKHCWEEDHNFSWYQKKLVGREKRLISRNTKEIKHSWENSYHSNKISYMLTGIPSSNE